MSPTLARAPHSTFAWRLALFGAALCLCFAAESLAAQFTLKWSDNSRNESGFKIERATGTSGTFTQVATTGANVTSYVDKNLPASTVFRYRIRAYNSAGHSSYSNIASGTTPKTSSSNTAPRISNIADRTVTSGTSSGTIKFTIADAESSTGDLILWASSSNQNILPNARLRLGGSGANRTLTFTPLAGVTGKATVTVRVGDGSLSTTDTFVVTVAAASVLPKTSNTAPTISKIANRSIAVNGASGAISFTIGDAQTPAANLTLIKNSSNKTLVPLNNITFGGSGANRTVAIRPVGNTSGWSTIWVKVSDGSMESTISFTVTVSLALTSGDIGLPAIAGATTTSGSTIKIRAAGTDIAGSRDQFRFARQLLPGDTELTVRLTGLTNTDASAKAGLMFRASVAADAAFAYVFFTPSGRVALQYRPSTGAKVVHKYHEASRIPGWLKLSRTGNSFYAYHSPDGVKWNLVDSVTVKLPGTVPAGLAVTSRNARTATTATFDKLTVD